MAVYENLKVGDLEAVLELQINEFSAFHNVIGD